MGFFKKEGGGVQESDLADVVRSCIRLGTHTFYSEPYNSFQFYGLVTPSESKSEKDQRVNGKYESRFSLSLLLGVNVSLRQQQDDRSAGFQLYGQRNVGVNKSWPNV